MLKLITVEYDVADTCRKLDQCCPARCKGTALSRRSSFVAVIPPSTVNAQTIAEFAGGNGRLALALADRVEEREDLSVILKPGALPANLFQQRQDDDLIYCQLRKRALSLVDSFNVDLPGAPNDELAVLSQLAERTPLQMNRGAAETLLRRQIAQKRSQWRAVLPHANANRLARFRSLGSSRCP